MRRLAPSQHPLHCSSLNAVVTSWRAVVAPVLLGLLASVALWGCGGGSSLSNLGCCYLCYTNEVAVT